MTHTAALTIAQQIAASIEAIRALPEHKAVNQTASLTIDADGTLALNTRHCAVTGSTPEIWHGLTLSLPLPSGIVPAKLAEWLDDVTDELETIVEGMDRTWDGSNMVGTLSDEASAQFEAWIRYDEQSGVEGLWRHENGEIVGVWEAGVWMYHVSHELAACATAEDAVTLAASMSGNGEVFDGPNDRERIWLDPEDVERYARHVWATAHP